MYHENQVSFTCPGCHRTGRAMVHDIISNDEQPELKGKILEGSFFEYVCPECGTVTPILYPCLYQDRERKYMIHLVDDDQKDNVFEDTEDSDSVCRTVRDPNQLAEKIAILDDNLDDRAIEIAKLYRKIRLEERNPGMKVEALYYQPSEGGARFVVLSDHGFEGTIRFDREAYEAILQEILPVIDEELMMETEINEEWAGKAAASLEKN